MVVVSVDGITQIPGVDYKVGTTKIGFLTAPRRGSTILMQSASGTQTYFEGDGSTYLFDTADSEAVKLRHMLDMAYIYRSVPAVADMLERLQVVVELAQQS